jgi:hypothetical protein
VDDCPKLTSASREWIFDQITRLRVEFTPDEMKTVTKNGKSRANGASFTRMALLAAHERALKRVSRMDAQEGFASLVKAGIYTVDGKLARRYGG